jgi:hypothetical protein
VNLEQDLIAFHYSIAFDFPPVEIVQPVGPQVQSVGCPCGSGGRDIEPMGLEEDVSYVPAIDRESQSVPYAGGNAVRAGQV